MITKKIMLTAVLGAATLFSATSFASYYHHPSYQPPVPMVSYHHYQPNIWRNMYFSRWGVSKRYYPGHGRYYRDRGNRYYHQPYWR
ncbi:hypothetical protein BN59_03153 [Legionella massiliensis]|uniref:PXPV repeat (3 copies) n=1 Tax=Legionella massiliensis TaxID=1034943 RepID=A0A078L3X7_9GAMM|nr:hypothetical protein [Legionella massiliensis]CDZ78839.1 hypothetical protein BN59_03153 [Legionella massiliensis]CEE14577.1 hypothetical protein BN1094_03153 [Legionella massiliensis]